MKKFDYLCIAYIVTLLIFGFDDKASSEKKTPQRTAIHQANRLAIALNKLPSRTQTSEGTSRSRGELMNKTVRYQK